MSPEWLFLALCLILLLYVSGFGRIVDMAISDLQKLVENMKRAQSITDRAAKDADKHSVIMDNFEKRLDVNHENMSKIEEYEKLMAAMDTGSNGGPALETTFPSSDKIVPTESQNNTSTGRFHEPTGKQL